MSPATLRNVHAVAYFADTLAPVWGMSALDPLILKGMRSPYHPQLQRDLDSLVGQAVVLVEEVSYSTEENDSEWRLNARYSLNHLFADRIVETARQFDSYNKDLKYVHEVVLAVSALGGEGLNKASDVDATYSDPLVDVGGVLDLADDETGLNPSAAVAFRFGELLGPERPIDVAEMTHLYIRHLYSGIQRAGR